MPNNNINGTPDNNLLYGTLLADNMDGKAGNDTLYAYDGDDQVKGGSGFDYIYAGIGNDTVDAGSEDDYVVGGDGKDSLVGGSGNDTIYGDNESGTIIPAGNLLVNASFEDVSDPSLSSADFGFYGPSIAGWVIEGGPNQFEVVSSGYRGVPSSDGTYWLDLDASPGNIKVAQTIAPITAGTVLHLGFDIANTPPHSDNGVEVFWNGASLGVFHNDTNVMQHFTLDVVATGGADKLSFGGTGDADYFGMSLDNVTLVGNATTVDSGDADNIDGGSGDDLIYAGVGNDTVTAGAGNDTVYGGAGDDKIETLTGDDRIYGGAGADTITSGTGYDRFIYTATSDSTAAAHDLIKDFNDAADKIDLTGLGFTGIAAGAAAGSVLGYSYVGGDTVITAAGVDFTITLSGLHALNAGEFIF